jgi:hypothetical protein
MFKDLGYYKEFYINSKFIGTLQSDKDREVIGYFGRKTETTTERIELDNKKVIKPNTEVVTMLYPLCGELK